jgi:outer membrane receptor protein involved in Fe transport
MDLGGPVLRDRVWFYAGYNPRFRRHERDVVFSDTGEALTFDDPRDTQSVNYNVTAQLSSKIRARAAMSNQRATNSGGRDLPSLEPDGTSNENADLFPNPLTHNSTTDSYAGNAAWVVTPKFFVNADAGFLTYNTYGVTDTEFSSALRHTFDGSNFAFPSIPGDLQQLDGYADLPASTRDVRDKYSRINLNLDGTYYGSFAGRHTLKSGVQFERLSNDVLTGAQAPTVSLHWDDARTTLDDPPRQVRGTYGYYTVARRFTEGKIHTNNVGLFLQDAWTLNNRVTLNLGVRADSETMPSYRPENPGLHFNLGDKIAPRLGFAYDVRGDGQWKAYGSWGMFYDISKLELPRGAWGADRWIDYHYTLDTFDWPSISCDGPEGSGCPGTFIELADRRHVSNDRENPLIDPDLKPIRTQEFTLGVDHELSRTMSVGVRYAHKWLDRLIEDVGVQVAGVGEVFMIANPGYGIAEFTLAGTCATCPAQPPAKRVYDGVEFRLRKRLSNHWSMITSYLWSRLYGNYSGLASSDENGRNSPSVDRFFDGEYMSFDQNGQPVFGRLGTDRPHQFKMQATYDFPWGTQIGVNYFLASGTPMSSTISFKSVPVFPFGRGDMGRTPVFSSTDLLIGHTFLLPGTTALNVNLNVFNLFDQDTITRYRTSRYRDDLPDLTDATFFQGFDSIAIANANPDIRPDPRFALADQWQGERTMRVQAKFMF